MNYNVSNERQIHCNAFVALFTQISPENIAFTIVNVSDVIRATKVLLMLRFHISSLKCHLLYSPLLCLLNHKRVQLQMEEQKIINENIETKSRHVWSEHGFKKLPALSPAS